MAGKWISAVMDRLAGAVIRQAQRTPYRHLLHADGSLYMGRWWLFRTRWLSARVHHIASPDYDRHMHDHPFSFVSIILRGEYVENRPQKVEPCFIGNGRDWEACTKLLRTTGSVAYRRCTQRHLISWVSDGGAWTLVFMTPKRQWWGFYTPAGKVFWQDYCSVHDASEQEPS